MVEFAMAHAGAGTHSLYIAVADHRAGAEAVLMLKRAFQHIRDDFHVFMAMGTKALGRLHAVFVDDDQRTEPHLFGVVVMAKTEGMVRFQPAMMCYTALCTFVNL